MSAVFTPFIPVYASVTLGSSVTTNLRNLTAVIPEVLADEKFYGPLNGQIKQFAPEAIVSIIRDEDVHNGYIFGSDGRNAYDVLFLLLMMNMQHLVRMTISSVLLAMVVQ